MESLNIDAEELKAVKEAGLPGDPVEFTTITEISIIAHLADNLFAKKLPDGLTTAQFGVLNHLIRLNRNESIGELAAVMQVSQPTMSSTVRKLEDKGYIRLIATDEDRRVRRVSVTETGIDIRNKSIEKIFMLREMIASQLPQSEWEAVLPFLSKLRFILDKARNT